MISAAVFTSASDSEPYSALNHPHESFYYYYYYSLGESGILPVENIVVNNNLSALYFCTLGSIIIQLAPKMSGD